MNIFHRRKLATWLAAIGLVGLVIWPRLTSLNQYLIVDEADRWRWAKDFVQALNRGDLAGTLVGDGYPGIVPVWLESVWIFIEAVRRSLVEGRWIGEIGLSYLLHEWERNEFLFQQRLPIVLFNTAIALAIVWAVWRLFGKRVALVSGLLIALDPFYLSDSRVNRAEAMITGLMTLSILSLIFYYRRRQFRYVFISGVFGGLSFLTKIQALSILPVVALTGLFICLGSDSFEHKKKEQSNLYSPLRVPTAYLSSIFKFGAGWSLAAGLTWLILWPSMWVTPLETLTLVFNYTTRKVGAEGVNLFFLGQTYQDSDPGVLFYPFVFLMRITPLVLLGLIGAVLRFTLYVSRFTSEKKNNRLVQDPFTTKGAFILVIYVLLYALVMTFGSHKQDRYLMPVFLGLDILAAMGLVYINYQLSIINYQFKKWEWLLFSGLVIVQAAIVLPHHPYYYSYFNPLFGGGQTAVNTMRIGWGEGMDQVGSYLAAKPDSRKLVVSSRFGHNMLDFKGEVIALGDDGRWTQADYIVLYIQQVQRRLDPGPDFIDYFQARTPEKIITLGGIDYAWIYPIPFTTSANPQVSLIPGQAALLGYSWETNPPLIRLLWQNLGATSDRRLMARLVGAAAETDWVGCTPGPDFTSQAQTIGAFVESLCAPELDPLFPDIYTVEFGLTSAGGTIESILFPQGWQAARLTPAGALIDTTLLERLDAIAADTVPAESQSLNRVYDRRFRLLAYQINPAQPRPGETLELTLFWQAVKENLGLFQMTVQLADSRSISLGRTDVILSPPDHGEAGQRWLPGEVKATQHKFQLAPDLDPPLAGRIEVSLKDEAEIPLQPTNLQGTQLDAVIANFTVAPKVWPTFDEVASGEVIWQNKIALRGYTVSPAPVEPGHPMQVGLFWQAGRPVAENFVVFVHLLDEAGQIKAQNDSLPRAGAYPAPWWPPGQVVEDTHPLRLPDDLPAGRYRLRVGLYLAEAGPRLPLADGRDGIVIGEIEVK